MEFKKVKLAKFWASLSALCFESFIHNTENATRFIYASLIISHKKTVPIWIEAS